MIKRDDLFPYLIISVFFHFLLIYFVFHSKEKPKFSSVPIEVSFYSSPQHKIADHSSFSIFKERNKPDNKLATNIGEVLNVKQKEDVVIKKENKLQEPKEKQKVEKQKVNVTKISEGNDFKTFQTPNSERFSLETSLQSEISSQGIISFDNPDFKYSYYAKQIVMKIKKQWRWIEKYEQLRIVVHFKIHRDGSVSDMSIKESSGNIEYDKYALNTIYRSRPFPDLPEDYEYDSLGIYFEFKHKS